MTTQLIYDNTFDGFLTGIFEIYDKKLSDVAIVRSVNYSPGLLSEPLNVATDHSKSKRVWEALQKKLSARKCTEVYKTFLSELPEMEHVLLNFIQYVISSKENIEQDLATPAVNAVAKIAHQVHREKHRMEAFVRFQRTKDDWYVASITPDFNVLPLIVSHFRDRYADQNWLIYDTKRNYGINYDRQTNGVTEVILQEDHGMSGEFLPASICHEEELAYQKLWQNYFHSVNIGARKNMKLHVQHVPVRYWKYLVEKRVW